MISMLFSLSQSKVDSSYDVMSSLDMDIYIMDADGSNQAVFISSPEWEQSPSWSPDGKRIVFESDVEGNDEIYIVSIDSGVFTRLTFNSASDNSPSWSPDGTKIAFASDRDGDDPSDISFYEIYVMDADGGNARRLTYNSVWDGSPSWSPDGKQIAFSSLKDGSGEIYLMDADGGNMKNLTNNPEKEDGDASWSPDGKRIVFTSWRDNGADIYRMDIDGGNVRRLTFDGAGFPAWSPDGTKIAFVSGHPSNIYIMGTDGGNVRDLTSNDSLKFDYGKLAWSPDGETLVYEVIFRPQAKSENEKEAGGHAFEEEGTSEKNEEDSMKFSNLLKFTVVGIASICAVILILSVRSRRKTQISCPKCRAANSPDSIFCSNCGARLQERET
jgi:Tol biopolymer transport system component